MPAPEGYTSLGVIGYTDKGTYAAGTTYNKFNVVLYNGSSYVAIKDGLTGVTPANDVVNWRLFANGFPDNGVTTDNFQATLENYLDQTESTATNKAPSSAYLKTIKDGLDEDISELTSSNTTNVSSEYAYRGNVSFRKYGNVKNIYIDGLKNVPVGESITICSIPEGFEAIFGTYTYDMVNIAGTPYRFSVYQQTLTIRIYADTFESPTNTIVCVSYI